MAGVGIRRQIRLEMADQCAGKGEGGEMKKTLIRQYSDGRWGFDNYSSGTRHMVRCKTKERALARAMDIDVFMANGRVDLLQSTAAEWDEFRKWKSASKHSPDLSTACAEFVGLKTGKSSRHTRSLRGDLALFETFIGPTQPIGAIKALDIQRFISSRNVGQRRQFNLRCAIVSLFRWARRMSYLADFTTEAEKVEPIEKKPGKANVLTPAEMHTLIANAQEHYLPWLCVAAFAGVRTEEIAPDCQSKKDPLRWEDFDWTHKLIVVREETAKTGQERDVPIPDNLAELLAPYRNAKGPICEFQPTNNETRRLGEFIGGWKHNCLRDSFCSYRARITQNIYQVSMEMGNSPAMVKRSYHKRQPLEPALAWFNIGLREESNVVAFA
jgi:hypothetical protein